MAPRRGADHRERSASSWTVRRLLALLVATCVGGILVLGTVGAVAVHRSTQTVDSLSRDLGPAQVANEAFMEEMLDAETELRAWQISGEPQQLEDYRVALARAPEAVAPLEEYVRTHPELAAVVASQRRLAAAWIDQYARPAIAAGPAQTTDRGDFALGVRRFDALKSVNGRIGDRLADQVASARDRAEERLDATVRLIAVVGLVGAAACGLLTWWVMRSIRRPLADLEDVVDRLARGELDARASYSGPAEARRVARAVNDMADEIARSREMEQEVQERLVEIDRVKSEFVANVSHELRTPLTSIAGYLELLAEDLGDDIDEEHSEMMAVVQRNVARLRALIEDLLDLGRAERSPDRLLPVDLTRLLGDVAEDLRLSAGSREVDITILADAAPVVVLGDPAQLQRLLVNLLSNAVKFSRSGGAVVLRLGTVGEEVEVGVTDSGIGIPEPDRAKLGERFFRASNAVTAQIPGTGLGLRMVQAIVSNHHGSFALSSQEGRGTTATVRLPLHHAEARSPGGAGPAAAPGSRDGPEEHNAPAGR